MVGSRWKGAGWSALLLLSLLAANLISLRLRPNPLYLVDIGFWGDQNLLGGVFEQETDGAGATYRWTTERATFAVRGFASIAQPLFRLTLGGLPPNRPAPQPVSIALEGTPLVIQAAAQPRTYHLLLPAGALLDGDLAVALTTATGRVEPDPRPVGVRLDDLAIGWSRDAWALPDWQTLLMQWALTLVWLAIAWRLGLPPWSQTAVAACLVLLLSWMTAYNLPTARAWELRLLAGSALLLALLWATLPRLARLRPDLVTHRQYRLLLMIVVVAVSLRLFGVFYPPFDSHDLYLHLGRLHAVHEGGLQLFDTPTEFGGRRTLVPPGFYVLLLPLTLITSDAGVAIEGLFAFADGVGVLLVAILVLLIGGSPRAAMLAALAAASLPIQFTALWWGFGPQIVAHWLMVAVVVLIMHRSPPARAVLLAVAALLSLAFLMHPGAGILGGACLGFYLLLLARRREDRAFAFRWGVALAASALLAALLLYGEQLGGAGGSAAAGQASDAMRLALIGAGLQASFRPIGVAVACISLVLLVLHTRGAQRLLVLGWLGAALLFLLVDTLLGLQVRYAYFATPLVCAALGFLLDRIMGVSRWGPLVAWSILGLIAWSGVSLWIEGVFLYVKPTLTALTH